MWKPGGESGQDICTSDSMEVVPSHSNTDVRSEEFMDAGSHHSLSFDDGMRADDDAFNQPAVGLPPALNLLPPSDVGELRQKSTPNILSWVAEQQQITMRLNGSVATRRPQSVHEGRRPRQEEYEKAAEEIRKIRRQCGM